MYATLSPAVLTCPTCGEGVHEVVITHVQCVFTAPVLALHRGVGHTLCLVGTRWVLRCGEEKALHPLAVVVGSDKVPRMLVAETAPDASRTVSKSARR